MNVICDHCGLRYDDVYRLTICPHERFEMRTVVVMGDGEVRVAHTVEELRTLVRKETLHEN